MLIAEFYFDILITVIHPSVNYKKRVFSIVYLA